VRGPKLRAKLDEQQGQGGTLTPEHYQLGTADQTVSGHQLSFYARLCVTNVKPRIAERCRAYLAKVEKEVNGTFIDTGFRDSMPLIWSYDSAADFIELPFRVPRHVDVVKIEPNWIGIEPQIWSPSGNVLSLDMYQHIFATRGKFRLTVLITANEIKPRAKVIDVNWDGRWPPTASEPQRADGRIRQVAHRWGITSRRAGSTIDSHS
jgi:hypothetical protein